MSMHGIDTSAPLWNVTGARARAMLQLFRQQMLAFAQVPHPEPASATRHAAAPSARPSIAELPAELQQLLKRYQAAHPGIRVELVSYLTYGTPGDTAAKFNMSDLPADDSLVVLAVTETVASATQVEVRSHVLVAQQRSGE